MKRVILAVLLLATGPVQAQPGCDRACLSGYIDTWFAALHANDVRRGDTGTEAIIRNSDGSLTMLALRLKVVNGAITEIETVKANEGGAGWP